MQLSPQKQLILPLRLQWKNVKIRYADHYGTVIQRVDRDTALTEAESILQQVAIYRPNYLVIGVDIMREWQIGGALEHQLSDQIVAGDQWTKSCNVIVAPLKSEELDVLHAHDLRIPIHSAHIHESKE